MKTKLFSRALAMMLASLMLLSAIACGKSGEATDTTTAATSAAATEATGEATSVATDADPADTATKDDLPADLNYNGAVVTFLYREELASDFWAEGQNGDLVNDAIFTSIASVEERLNVDIQTVLRKGNDNDVRTEYNNHIYITWHYLCS